MTHTTTHTMTLVLQRIAPAGAMVNLDMARALIEYALDLADGAAGSSTFERHVNQGCRIEAIRSLPPLLGGESREDIVAADGIGALAARIADLRELAAYLPGGDRDDAIAAALGFDHAQAAAAIRDKLREIDAALPVAAGFDA